MDPLTHTLTAWTLARAGADRLGPYATATLVLSANAPAISFLYLFGGAEAYLEQASWSHSLAGAVVLGAGVALAFWRWARRRPRPPRLANLLLLGWLGTLSHILMDWSTSVGVQLSWPFKSIWYSLDWFAWLDLWLLVILLLGLALPALFRLIAEEIGARRSKKGARRGAWVALTACALLAAGRASLHSQGVAELDSRLYGNRSPARAGAFPTPLSPFRWSGAVETDTTFEVAELSLLGSGRGFETFATHFKPEPSPMLEAALATRTARLFLSWARFPRAEIVPTTGGGWRMEMKDLRYAVGPGSFFHFTARVVLDSRLAIVDQGLSFGGEGD
jgi:membrane-bound metal-dependent hydrolase YbcI (DUF457 family)